jgi:hypothetical protein
MYGVKESKNGNGEGTSPIGDDVEDRGRQLGSSAVFFQDVSQSQWFFRVLRGVFASDSGIGSSSNGLPWSCSCQVGRPAVLLP